MSKKHYPIRIPRYAKGIRAQELRTGAGRSWWEKRWIATLERMNLNGRLGRGRNYALAGQVVEMKIEGPHVEAKVVGTREAPYLVTVDFRMPEGVARARIVAALKSEPMLVARMLADDLPTEVEEIFKREGCDLFPGGRLKVEDEVKAKGGQSINRLIEYSINRMGGEKVEKRGGGGEKVKGKGKRPTKECSNSIVSPLPSNLDLQPESNSSVQPSTSNPQPVLQPRLYDMTTKCSCPDYANPCKHSGAVLLILGEEISRRPMTLVELRGIRMEELY